MHQGFFGCFFKTRGNTVAHSSLKLTGLCDGGGSTAVVVNIYGVFIICQAHKLSIFISFNPYNNPEVVTIIIPVFQ